VTTGADDTRDIRISTLENGLRVVTDRMETVETASVGVWVDAGARDELAEVNGVSHLLEHMAFKGTKKRDAYAIAAEIEAVGGHLNAYTSRENTAYYAKVLKEDVGLAVDLIGDILQNSVMDEGELARERAVILQEIHQAHDTPDDIVFDHFQETAYPDQPIGRPVLGRPDVVGSMARDRVLAYMRTRYSAPRLTLAAAGKVDHDEILALAQETFTGLPDHADEVRADAAYRGGDFREVRDLEQMHIVLGVEGISYLDDDFYAASVLSAILGGGMSSRLFQEVREKRGLAYSISTFLSCFTDTGVFGIYAGTGGEESGELMDVVLDEIDKIKSHVDAEEVARARAQLKASLLMGLESTSSRCEQLAQQMLVFGRPIPTAEIVDNVEAVDEAAVKRVAERIFRGTPTLAALGPVGKLADAESVAARLGA
jgi:predicted Zn-dependent peptidase